MTPTVELHSAFFWTCDQCGKDNFERGITVAPETIDMNDLPESVDPEMVKEWFDGGGEGSFIMSPTDVQCRFCSEQFKVES